MTNEELAIQIQLGHTEYYTELWDKVKRLMHKILYLKLSEVTLPNYISTEDLEQDLYFAFCNAVQAYDDTKPYKFNSYLEFHIRNLFRNMNKGITECSYNRTINEDEKNELIDLIADDTAKERLQDIELTDLQVQVRQAVAELPTKERQVITWHFLEEQTYTQIAKTMNVSTSAIQHTAHKGLTILRRNRAIKGIYDEFYRHYSRTEDKYYIYTIRWYTSIERTNTLLDIQTRRLKGEYISYGQEQSILALAKQKYIKEQAVDTINYRYLCGVK